VSEVPLYVAASENGGAFRRVGDVIFSIDREVPFFSSSLLHSLCLARFLSSVSLFATHTNTHTHSLSLYLSLSLSLTHKTLHPTPGVDVHRVAVQGPAQTP